MQKDKRANNQPGERKRGKTIRSKGKQGDGEKQSPVDSDNRAPGHKVDRNSEDKPVRSTDPKKQDGPDQNDGWVPA